MDNVVVVVSKCDLVRRCPADGILDHSSVLLGQPEILLGEVVYNGVNLNNGRINSMGNESRGCRADTKTSAFLLAS